MIKLIIPLTVLISGCGISVSTSGIKAGLIDREVFVKDDSVVVSEEVIGFQLNWLPDYTWGDFKKMWTKSE